MISDVLSSAIDDIDYYMNDSFYDDIYKDQIRDEILTLRQQMEKLRLKLDEVPSEPLNGDIV